MFGKTTLLTTITLAIFASAIPAKVDTGISIPLHQRGSLTRDDGGSAHSKAILATVRVKNKYRQNLINHVRNGGSLPVDARILPVIPVPAMGISKRQQENMMDADDLVWVGYVTIGSNNQKFLINFDTGSADLWVPNSNCTVDACHKKRKYNASGSNTSSRLSGFFQIEYGDASTSSGPIFTDTVTVAGISVRNQVFSPVTNLSPVFGDRIFDGIMGLAYPKNSRLPRSPFFNHAFQSGAIRTNRFAFKLASSGSQLFLGGEDRSLFSGSFETHDVNTKTGLGHWRITGASAIVNGNVVSSGFDTIIDSGTTLICGPPHAVEAVYSAIPGSSVFDEDNGLYQFPCSSDPTIVFNWGGKDWTISRENFNFGSTEDDPDQCVGGIMSTDFGLGDNVWILGDTFMKNVYTSFDFGTNTVGFATLV